MKQQKIRYKDVIDLGFIETLCDDKVWEDIYGYPYKIISYPLTDRSTIYWHQDTRLCERVVRDFKSNVVLRKPIEDLDELKMLIGFKQD